MFTLKVVHYSGTSAKGLSDHHVYIIKIVRGNERMMMIREIRRKRERERPEPTAQYSKAHEK